MSGPRGRFHSNYRSRKGDIFVFSTVNSNPETCMTLHLNPSLLLLFSIFTLWWGFFFFEASCVSINSCRSKKKKKRERKLEKTLLLSSHSFNGCGWWQQGGVLKANKKFGS